MYVVIFFSLVNYGILCYQRELLIYKTSNIIIHFSIIKIIDYYIELTILRLYTITIKVDDITKKRNNLDNHKTKK